MVELCAHHSLSPLGTEHVTSGREAHPLHDSPGRTMGSVRLVEVGATQLVRRVVSRPSIDHRSGNRTGSHTSPRSTAPSENASR
jgi:hypothetical protein